MNDKNPYASTEDEAKNYAEGHSAIPLQGPTGELLKTVFDNRDNPHPIPPAPAPKVKKPQKTISTAPKDHSKALSVMSIFLAIFAIVGIVLGIIGITSASTAENNLKISQEQLATANAIISQVETETGAKINSADDVPAFRVVKGYLYLNDWTLRFKIPAKLTRLSYSYDSDGNYHPKLCATGIQEGDTTAFPAFADIKQNKTGIGCLTRVATSEGSTDSDGNSFGELIQTADGYNYFYTRPTTFSEDSAEAALEQNAEQLVKAMFMDNSNYK